MERLYRKYYAPALLYAVSLCGEPHLAEDLVADAFVKAYLSLPDETPSFLYWLFRVCKNLWLDQLRRRKFVTDSAPLAHMVSHDTPEERYMTTQRHKALWKAIRKLSPADREIITLHYFSGLPLAQVAQLTGIGYAALRQRISRLRKTLKKQLEEQGYGSETCH